MDHQHILWVNVQPVLHLPANHENGVQWRARYPWERVLHNLSPSSSSYLVHESLIIVLVLAQVEDQVVLLVHPVQVTADCVQQAFLPGERTDHDSVSQVVKTLDFGNGVR